MTLPERSGMAVERSLTPTDGAKASDSCHQARRTHGRQIRSSRENWELGCWPSSRSRARIRPRA